MGKKNKEEDFSPNSLVSIDGTEIKSYLKDIYNHNVLEVEVGTTGHQGGGTNYGGRTYFRISDAGCTDMRCKIKGQTKSGYIEKEVVDASSIEISFGGDAELDTFCEALRIGYEVLKQHAYPMNDVDDESTNSEESTPFEKRQERFASYINVLCDAYRENKNLKGMGKIRDKYHISGLTKQQFFECGLHHATGYVSKSFCDKVYDFVLDRTKATEAPKFSEQ